MDKSSEKITKDIKKTLIIHLINLVKPYRWWFYVLLLMALIIGILEPSRPYLVQVAIDRYMSLKDERGLLRMIILMVELLVIQTSAQYFLSYVSNWLGQQVVKDLRIRLYTHLLHLNATFHTKTPIGKLLTHTITDSRKVIDLFSQDLAAVLVDGLQLICMGGFMFYIDWQLALLSLSTIPLLMITAYFLRNKIRKTYALNNENTIHLNAFTQSRLNGMKFIQLFNRQDEELGTFKNLNERCRQSNDQANIYSSLYFSSLEVIRAFSISLLIWKGTSSLLQGHTTLGSLTAFLMYIKMFFRPLSHLAEHFSTLQMGLVSMDKIIELLNTHTTVPTKPNGIIQPIRGHITFKDVWFAYARKDYVLKNISFNLPAQQSLAIVGTTGAGKSTLINLVERFYDPQQGTITVDGINIQDYNLHTLRRHIGMVLQDTFLFSGSIYENITLGDPSIDKETVVQAARILGIDSFIQNLPDNYDYQVGEGGLALSMGQKQLLAFLRVLVYNPPIVILDEATASLDIESEQLVQQAIRKVLVNRTTIRIAHRLTTIQDADTILLLENGEIKESGNHQTLLAQNGRYAALYYAKVQVA